MALLFAMVILTISKYKEILALKNLNVWFKNTLTRPKLLLQGVIYLPNLRCIAYCV